MRRARQVAAAVSLALVASACQLFLVFDENGNTTNTVVVTVHDEAGDLDASSPTDVAVGVDADAAAVKPTKYNCPDPDAMAGEVLCDDFDDHGDQFQAHGWDSVGGALVVDSDAAVSKPNSLSASATTGKTACITATLAPDITFPDAGGMAVDIRFHLKPALSQKADVVVTKIAFGTTAWQIQLLTTKSLFVSVEGGGVIQATSTVLVDDFNQVELLVRMSTTTDDSEVQGLLNGTPFASGTLGRAPSHGSLSVSLGICDPVSAPVDDVRFDDVHVIWR